MLPFEGGITHTDNGTLVFAVLLAIAYLFYGQRRTTPLKVAAKTLSVMLLAGLSASAGGPWLLTLALVLCAIGDFFLAIEQMSEKFFLAGLGAFLAGHIAYILLFFALPASETPLPLPVLAIVGVAMTAIALVMGRRLFSAAGDLRWPVMVYIAAILVMGLAALSNGAGLIVAGAASFMISDTVLASERFLLKKDGVYGQFAGPVVWVTYFGAQVLILFGVLTVWGVFRA
ncbi:lysoplasmalogenase [Oricola indica]|jgi:uncharacterized membrane protein YhhN|uniref:lysoplasmalogenase n=1 Tax=Oricola indica TaxID=2872591 RepID=UPI001CC15356|nr:lysoplasmalogenase [Oricola indica]